MEEQTNETEAENLSKRYGEKLAVDGRDFVARPGIVLGLNGEVNG
jgi:ABC-type multidrug transport system ATPase subunit